MAKIGISPLLAERQGSAAHEDPISTLLEVFVAELVIHSGAGAINKRRGTILGEPFLKNQFQSKDGIGAGQGAREPAET